MLKPEISLPIALATGVLVWSIYQNATPAYVDLRGAPPGDPDVSKSERLATWTAAGAVSGISLLARDPVIFMVGGAFVVVLAWWNRHGNAVDPMTGTAVPRGTPASSQLPADLDYVPA